MEEDYTTDTSYTQMSNQMHRTLDFTRRGRAENFSDAEKEIMINVISQHISLMDSRRGPAEINRRKTAILEYIVRELTRRCPNRPRRAVFQVRKWWKRTKIRHKRLARFQLMGKMSPGEKQPNLPTSPVDIRVHHLLNRVGKYGVVTVDFPETIFSDETHFAANEQPIDVVVIDDIKEEADQQQSSGSYSNTENFNILPDLSGPIDNGEEIARQESPSVEMDNMHSSDFHNSDTVPILKPPSFARENSSAIIKNTCPVNSVSTVPIPMVSSYNSTARLSGGTIHSRNPIRRGGSSFNAMSHITREQQVLAPRLRKELRLLDLQEDHLRSEHRSKMELLDLQKSYYRRLLLQLDYPTSRETQGASIPQLTPGVFGMHTDSL